jgi:hypothetical protein
VADARDRARDRRDAARLRLLLAEGRLEPATPAIGTGTAAPSGPPSATVPSTRPGPEPEPEPMPEPTPVQHEPELFDDTGPIELPRPAAPTCDDCGFVAKTPAGLAAHRRVHRTG